MKILQIKKVKLKCSNPLNNPDCEKVIERMKTGSHMPAVCFSCKRYRQKTRYQKLCQNQTHTS